MRQQLVKNILHLCFVYMLFWFSVKTVYVLFWFSRKFEISSVQRISHFSIKVLKSIFHLESTPYYVVKKSRSIIQHFTTNVRYYIYVVHIVILIILVKLFMLFMLLCVVVLLWFSEKLLVCCFGFHKFWGVH